MYINCIIITLIMSNVIYNVSNYIYIKYMQKLYICIIREREYMHKYVKVLTTGDLGEISLDHFSAFLVEIFRNKNLG